MYIDDQIILQMHKDDQIILQMYLKDQIILQMHIDDQIILQPQKDDQWSDNIETMYTDDQVILQTHKDDQWSDLEGEVQGKVEACSSHCASAEKNKLTSISKKMSTTTNKLMPHLV